MQKNMLRSMLSAAVLTEFETRQTPTKLWERARQQLPHLTVKKARRIQKSSTGGNLGTLFFEAIHLPSVLWHAQPALVKGPENQRKILRLLETRVQDPHFFFKFLANKGVALCIPLPQPALLTAGGAVLHVDTWRRCFGSPPLWVSTSVDACGELWLEALPLSQLLDWDLAQMQSQISREELEPMRWPVDASQGAAKRMRPLLKIPLRLKRNREEHEEVSDMGKKTWTRALLPASTLERLLRPLCDAPSGACHLLDHVLPQIKRTWHLDPHTFECRVKESTFGKDPYWVPVSRLEGMSYTQPLWLRLDDLLQLIAHLLEIEEGGTKVRAWADALPPREHICIYHDTNTANATPSAYVSEVGFSWLLTRALEITAPTAGNHRGITRLLHWTLSVAFPTLRGSTRHADPPCLDAMVLPALTSHLIYSFDGHGVLLNGDAVTVFSERCSSTAGNQYGGAQLWFSLAPLWRWLMGTREMAEVSELVACPGRVALKLVHESFCGWLPLTDSTGSTIGSTAPQDASTEPSGSSEAKSSLPCFISEAGVHALLLHSSLPGVKEFQTWFVLDLVPRLHSMASQLWTKERLTKLSTSTEIVELGPASFADVSRKHLYALSTNTELERGRLKLGVAQDLSARMTQLQTGQSEPFRMLCVWPHMEKLESLALRSLPVDPEMGGTEWRRATLEEAKVAVATAFHQQLSLTQLPPAVTGGASANSSTGMGGATGSASGTKRRREAEDEEARNLELQMARDRHTLDMRARSLELEKEETELLIRRQVHELEMERGRAQIAAMEREGRLGSRHGEE